MGLKVSSEAFETALEDFEDYRRNYSGRGMYGEECVAIVLGRGESAWGALRELQRSREYWDAGDDDVADEIIGMLTWMVDHEPREDSLGLGTVLYWPSLKVAEE